MGPPEGFTTPPPPRDGDYVDIFCRGVNGLMEQSVVGPIKAVAQVRDAQPQAATKPLDQDMFWRTVKSPPELILIFTIILKNEFQIINAFFSHTTLERL